MHINTSTLIDGALEWAVCMALGRTDMRIDPDGEMVAQDVFDYTTDWSQAGPIIEREITKGLHLHGGAFCVACYFDEKIIGKECYGATPLIAAMRCFVASVLGDTVDIPEELCK